MSDVVAVYADGGVLRKNPSPYGGMWAWCHVNGAGERVSADSGLHIWPGTTNNQTELIAVIRGLSAVPRGWAGTLYSDSEVTLRRVGNPLAAAWAGIPSGWVQQACEILERLGDFKIVLLAGHPTRVQLAAGVGKHGSPVSEHNVWCDKTCTAIGRLYLSEQVAA